MQQVTAALLLLFCAISIYSKDDENIAQKAEMQKKIVEYREKSSKVIHKITAAREEAENESRTHERYKENFSKELKHLEKEKNELNTERERLSKSSDSLSRKISSVRRQSHETDLLQTQFRKSLLSAIDNYSLALNEVPAPVLKKESESLAFLKSELSSGSISNIEATERLWQITSTVNKNRLKIDVWSAQSTWEEITGQAHYLRLGYAYIAMVDDEAGKAALWNGSRWDQIVAPSAVLNLRTAVKIRNGNTLPEIVSLPLPEPAAMEASNVK